MKKIFVIIFLLCIGVNVQASNYYVATTGDDANDGLDSANAWFSIDNGESLSILNPGDTINVYPGTYLLSQSLSLSTSGMENLPVVYRKTGPGSAIIDGNGNGTLLVFIKVNHIEFDGFELTNSNKTKGGIRVIGDSCKITNCFLNSPGRHGFNVLGSDNLFLRNIITQATDHGILLDNSASNNLIYGNTIYLCGKQGLEIWANVKTTRIFNNIIARNDKGINAKVENIAAFNNVWNNVNGNYVGGVVDSAGGLLLDPLFVDTASADFSLQSGSPCIDSGLNVGYSFLGSTPDMGALEYISSTLNELPILDSIGAKAIEENQNLNFTLNASDAESVPLLTTSALPSGSGFIDNSDGTGTFNWTPTYIQAGIYNLTFYATDDSSAVDSEVVAITVNNVDRPPILAAIGAKNVEEGQNLNFVTTATDPDGTTPSLATIDIPTNASFLDNADGTGTFNFDPNYTQEAIYNVTFIANSGGLSDTEIVAITVTPAPITYIEVTPLSIALDELLYQQYTAQGFDAGFTLVRDLTDSVVWTTTDPSGSISGSGLYNAGNILSPPDYYNKAVYQGSLSDSGSVTVISDGTMSYIQIESLDGTPIGDTILTTDNNTTVLYARGYTSGNSLLGDVFVSWSLIDSGGIASNTPSGGTSTTLSLVGIGSLWVIASHNSMGHLDTTGRITSIAGIPANIIITPNTAIVSADSTLQFNLQAFDADANFIGNVATGSWSVSGGIGNVTSPGGIFTPQTVGTGNIIVTALGLVDTTGDVTVTPGLLHHIVATPDTVRVGLGDSVQFNAIGFDSKGNQVSPGDISWKLIGRNGTIDSTGIFIATRAGNAIVSATSSNPGMADTTGYLGVEELLFTSIPIGNNSVCPGKTSKSLLSFRLENYFPDSKTATSITVRTDFRGVGNSLQKLSNVQSLMLYLDKNNDSILSVEDSLLHETALSSKTLTFNINPLTITSGSSYTLFIAAKIKQHPHDNDTLDLYMHPRIDITTLDATLVAGPDSANSSGNLIIDGSLASQYSVISTGTSIATGNDSLNLVYAIDIPRNGYSIDTLNTITLRNWGTAQETDFDSLTLFVDNGNGNWDGAFIDIYAGKLIFTGAEWTRSGIDIVLNDLQNRFFVAADLSAFPTSGRTIAIALPVNGVEVRSGNDGPIDSILSPTDTITIQSNQQISIIAIQQPEQALIPGLRSPPIQTFQINNSYSIPIQVDSFRFDFMFTDPDGALQAQLESQIDSISLYLEGDNDQSLITGADSLISTSIISNGSSLLNTNNFNLPSMGSQSVFSLVIYLNQTNAKNNNLINSKITSISDIYFGQITQLSTQFPIVNQFEHTINSFTSNMITMVDPDSAILNAGDIDIPVLAITLPSNGYAEDKFERMFLENKGTVNDQIAIADMQLWVDLTGDGYTQDDEIVGSFSKELTGWEIRNASYTINPGGQKFIVTTSVINGEFESGMLLLEIPTGGISYKSGMDGPDDTSIQPVVGRRVYPSDRITVISIPQSSFTIQPANTEFEMLRFALYNGYGNQNQSLQSITFTNHTHGRSSLSFSDFELGQISLYYDSDNNRVFNNDSLVASGFFQNGHVQFSGLDLVLPADSLTYFFVSATVPLDLIDSDSLDIEVENPADLVFGSPVVINGDIPLVSGGHRVVNGSIAAQYSLVGQTPGSLSPGDTSITLYAFKPAINGNLTDSLESVRIWNLGDADSTDISQLELWIDQDANSIYSAGDSLLSIFTYIVGNGWNCSNLGLEIDGISPILFILGDISPTATPARTFRGEIPVNGCTYQSDNDGPIDIAITSNDLFSISSSGLSIAYQQMNNSYSIGQPIAVRFTVTNLLLTTMTNVIGRMASYSDSTIVTYDSSQAGPVSLTAGQSTDFVYYYTANQVGQLEYFIQAIEQTTFDSSAILRTNKFDIQQLPNNINLEFTNSIPTSVTKGQRNIFPFSFSINHADTSGSAASIRLDSLTINVKDGQQFQPADAVFSRIALNAGYTSLAVMDIVPAQSAITLLFSEPVIVNRGETIRFSLLVDIDSLATANGFSLSVESATSIPIIDNIGSQSVSYASTVGFPLVTAACRIDTPSKFMVLSNKSLVGPFANYGQNDVDFLQLDLRHPGTSGNSQIQLTNLTLQLYDSAGNLVIPSSIISNIRLKKNTTIISELTGTALDTLFLNMQLSSPVTLNAGEKDSIKITATIKPGSSISKFSLGISDSLAFIVRDLSSGSLLDIATDTTVLATGSIFPIQTGIVQLKQPATSPVFCPTSLLPVSTVGGIDSLQMVTLVFRYPVATGYSALMLNQVLVTVMDSLGTPLDPAILFDRLGYIDNLGIYHYQQFVLTESGQAKFMINQPEQQINPGDSLSITLIGDISVGSFLDHFVLSIGSSNNFGLIDITDTTSSPGVTIPGTCTETLPFITPATYVFQPAGRPAIVDDIGLVRITYPGEKSVPLFNADINYNSQISQGDISINGLKGGLWKRSSTGFNRIAENSVFSSSSLFIGGSLLVTDSNIVSDTLLLQLLNPFVVNQGENLEILLQGDIKQDAEIGNYVMIFDDSTYLDIVDANLQTTIFPTLATGDYPIIGTEFSIVATSLEESFSNYPNPFNPDEGPTTIAYVLSDNAQVDIELYTITGDLVKEILVNGSRAAGVNQSDIWSGKNGSGHNVLPGTYFCRIVARYTNGEVDSFRRKVAVIR